MVNQVELHPFFAQDGALETMKEFEVQPEAWGPLAEGKHGIFTNEKLTAIAEKIQKECGAGSIALERPERCHRYSEIHAQRAY